MCADPFLLHGFGESQKGQMQLGLLQMPEVTKPYIALGKAIQQNAKNRSGAHPLKSDENTPRPPNAANRTVYAIRPKHLIGIENRDSADAAGDIFFWIKDRILHPMR